MFSGSGSGRSSLPSYKMEHTWVEDKQALRCPNQGTFAMPSTADQVPAASEDKRYSLHQKMIHLAVCYCGKLRVKFGSRGLVCCCSLPEMILREMK